MVSNSVSENTISGGWSNSIWSSTAAVITGGGGDNDGGLGTNTISGSNTSTISGGSKNLILGVKGTGNTLTGGLSNSVYDIKNDMSNDCVVTGGNSNWVGRKGSVIMGGHNNVIFGKNSIALGANTETRYDHSMVVNLMEPKSELEALEATQEGHFLVNANSFRFQVGNGDSATINSENINRLKKELLE